MPCLDYAERHLDTVVIIWRQKMRPGDVVHEIVEKQMKLGELPTCGPLSAHSSFGAMAGVFFWRSVKAVSTGSMPLSSMILRRRCPARPSYGSARLMMSV